MKTSFAPFEQKILFRNAEKNGTYIRLIYIDCEKVTAVSSAIDSNGNIIDGQCDVFISDEMYFTVIGKPEAVLATVCSHCKEKTS